MLSSQLVQPLWRNCAEWASWWALESLLGYFDGIRYSDWSQVSSLVSDPSMHCFKSNAQSLPYKSRTQLMCVTTSVQTDPPSSTGWPNDRPTTSPCHWLSQAMVNRISIYTSWGKSTNKWFKYRSPSLHIKLEYEKLYLKVHEYLKKKKLF